MFQSQSRAAGAQLRRIALSFLVAGAGVIATSSALPIQDPVGTPPPAPAPVKKPAGLKIGEKAPALAVAKWVKGDAVPALESGKSYVVMFFATWNDPSKRAIPHVTELQKKYPDITFIGVSCWEKEKDQSKVEPFVTEMGDKMAYHIATDLIPEAAPSGNDGAMAKGWMSAAGRTTVPAAFVVDKGGLIGWIGHPMDLDPVVDKVAAGKWDTLAEAKKLKADAEVKSRLAVIKGLEQGAIKNPKEALESCDAVLALDPTKEKEVAGVRYHCLLALKDYDKAYAYGAKLVEGVYKDDPGNLNGIAWWIVAPEEAVAKKDLELAKKAAARANELTKSAAPELLDTYALVLFELGDIDKAIELQEKAVPLSKGKQFEKEVTERLEMFKKAKAGGGK